MSRTLVVPGGMVSRNFHFWKIALLSLCLGGLVLLPVMHIGPLLLEAHETETGSIHFHEYSEFEEEFLPSAMGQAAWAELASLRFRLTHLNYHSADLLREPSPPEQ